MVEETGVPGKNHYLSFKLMMLSYDGDGDDDDDDGDDDDDDELIPCLFCMYCFSHLPMLCLCVPCLLSTPCVRPWRSSAS